jgi:predicted AAA+ superfamily ATPase
MQLNSLVIFRSLLSSPVIKKLQALLTGIENSTEAIDLYSGFVSELYHNYDNFSEFIYHYMLEDENFYIKAKAIGKNPGPFIENALEKELLTLHSISLLRSDDLKGFITYAGYLPDWGTSDYDFTFAYSEHIKNISKTGFGAFSKYHIFTVSGNDIVPVKSPDPVRLSSFACYERERSLIVKNTIALLEGTGANNVLLYGDAGTGKSSTVKAIANEFKENGIRLIEVKRDQLGKLPDIIEQLDGNPLKFIIFIDDLSFMKNDDNFTALKAHLEGSVSAGGNNIAIYATSNRRHLVKEHLADRDGDEVHVNDSLQEIMSLASRFGLTVTFQKPDKDVYFQIVSHIASACGLPAGENLFADAEAFAIRHSGRSPRTARQFVELRKSGLF